MRRAIRAVAVGLCAWGVLAAGIPDAQAQRPIRLWGEELLVEEQPGVVPDPDAERLPAAFQRQLVFFRTAEPPGTIIINTSERFLYLVQGNNRALRYGIGVGRDGFQWSRQEAMFQVVVAAQALTGFPFDCGGLSGGLFVGFLSPVLSHRFHCRAHLIRQHMGILCRRADRGMVEHLLDEFQVARLA
jgi:hypothetical protein